MTLHKDNLKTLQKTRFKNLTSYVDKPRIIYKIVQGVCGIFWSIYNDKVENKKYSTLYFVKPKKNPKFKSQREALATSRTM
jgi:hypothetical protein